MNLKFRAWNVKENKMYYRGYQKLLHVLLCEDDLGENDGKGRPVKRAGYGDCVLLESTGLLDKSGAEIYEGDIVRIAYKGHTFTGVVAPVPDMFRSRKLHPLHDLLIKHGIPENPGNLEIEVLGNEYEHPKLVENS